MPQSEVPACLESGPCVPKREDRGGGERALADLHVFFCCKGGHILAAVWAAARSAFSRVSLVICRFRVVLARVWGSPKGAQAGALFLCIVPSVMCGGGYAKGIP